MNNMVFCDMTFNRSHTLVDFSVFTKYEESQILLPFNTIDTGTNAYNQNLTVTNVKCLSTAIQFKIMIII